jgi:hypothetical protein
MFFFPFFFFSYLCYKHCSHLNIWFGCKCGFVFVRHFCFVS